MSIALETKMHATRDDTLIGSGDVSRFVDAATGAIWDPRADLDDDGNADADDADLFDLKQPSWNTREAGPLATVSQAFSDVDNRYAFQGVPHFVMDTAANATAANAKLILGHHRARLIDVMTGRWNTRDPSFYDSILIEVPWPISVEPTLAASMAEPHFNLCKSCPGSTAVAQRLKPSSAARRKNGATDDDYYATDRTNHFLFALGNPNACQDPLGLDCPGCDGVPGAFESPCVLECCAMHDRCYDQTGCTASSWINPFASSKCKACNRAVLCCITACVWTFAGDDPDYPNYYCAVHHVFFDSPYSEHMTDCTD